MYYKGYASSSIKMQRLLRGVSLSSSSNLLSISENDSNITELQLNIEN